MNSKISKLFGSMPGMALSCRKPGAFPGDFERNLKEPVHAIPPSGLVGLSVGAGLTELLQCFRRIAGHGEVGNVTIALMFKAPAFIAIAPQRRRAIHHMLFYRAGDDQTSVRDPDKTGPETIA